MRDGGSQVGVSRKVLVIFVALMAGNAMAALDTTMVATATPTIVGDLGGIRDLAWIARNTMSSGIELARPQSTEPVRKMAIAPRKIRLRPYMSPSFP